MAVLDLQERLDKGERVTVLDIRPPSRRQEWHIPRSLYVDAFPSIQVGDDRIFDTIDLPRDQPVVVVCNAGFTSVKGAKMLRKRGVDAYSLEGGMRAWGLAWNVAETATKDGSATVLQVRRAGKGCLSYIVGAGDQALVIDASLDPSVYEMLAQKRGWSITKAFDTHIHADHVSRSRRLAEMTSAELYLPVNAAVSYTFTPLRESEEITLGSTHLGVMATPGHTLESSSYLIGGELLLTGDTLFQTGAGRPDFGSSRAETKERAHILYQSLQRLKKDAANAFVLASHTATPPGFDRVLIGGALSDIAKTNPLMRLEENAFVEQMLSHIPDKLPQYDTIIEFNQAGVVPDTMLVELEAGANRCAAG